MNNQTEGFLEELINKHNFIVKVTLDPEDDLCVMVEFAGRKQAYYRAITDEDGEIYGVGYWSSLMTDSEGESFEEFLPLRASVIRTYIVCDIFRQCRALDLAYDIIRFYSSDGNRVEFTELLTLQMDDNDTKAEKLVEHCMTAILNGEADVVKLSEALEKEGILQSFNVIRGTLL